MTYRLTFDITAGNADSSDLLDRLIEFQQQLVNLSTTSATKAPVVSSTLISP